VSATEAGTTGLSRPTVLPRVFFRLAFRVQSAQLIVCRVGTAHRSRRVPVAGEFRWAVPTLLAQPVLVYVPRSVHERETSARTGLSRKCPGEPAECTIGVLALSPERRPPCRPTPLSISAL